jgi:hypothetical protein
MLTDTDVAFSLFIPFPIYLIDFSRQSAIAKFVASYTICIRDWTGMPRTQALPQLKLQVVKILSIILLLYYDLCEQCITLLFFVNVA